MNNEIETIGIILSKKSINDYDENICVLTNEGIEWIFCKGVRKITSKNSNALNILSIANLELIISKYPNLNKRLKRASLITAFPIDVNMAKIQEKLLYFFKRIRSKNCQILIEWYLELAKLFNQNKDNKIITFLLFKILQIEGINPRLDGCVECGNTKQIVDFAFYKGGYLCRKHTINQSIMNVNILKSLFYLDKTFELYASNVSHEDNKTILKLITEYLTELI
ncbi:DNA repair protein RecO [[Mycoplasma] anseris]|uniref:DNA repair protein RecO n=1 Tax=[Mycoplasma] anseris TaxID=92400 RepID=A0A2Z4NDG8_9BACT|nr:DNA repair protein RecO [[Mycoplasma] anseris]AWX69633.1 DNA repair protein RecO [[Mycoplasma] anseris]